MTRRIVHSTKDENGIYSKAQEAKPAPALPEPDVSLDDIAKRIVTALNRATKHLLDQISGGDVSREVIGALKDCEAMHRELSKKEQEFLDSSSDEQLEKMLKNAN